MDMRCDSVDIAKFLGAYGPAATHVNQQQINGDNKRHNETKKQINMREVGLLILLFCSNLNKNSLFSLAVEREHTLFFWKKKNRNTIYERPAVRDGSGRVNDNQNHHISVWCRVTQM